MNKLIVLMVIVLGSLTLFHFGSSGFSYMGVDTVKHLNPEHKYVNETNSIPLSSMNESGQ